MRPTLAALALLLASPAMAANYATCILDKAPGIQNDTAAMAAAHSCMASHPGGIDAIQQGSGRGIFGFKSGMECIAKKAADTRSEIAAYQISLACRKLYDFPFDPTGARPAN